MPITFEDVSGQIERGPENNDRQAGAETPRTPGPQGMRAELDRELRQMAERAARICAD